MSLLSDFSTSDSTHFGEKQLPVIHFNSSGQQIWNTQQLNFWYWKILSIKTNAKFLIGQTFKASKGIHSSFLYIEYMYGMNTQRPLNLHPLLSFPSEDLSYLEVKVLKKKYMYIESKKAIYLGLQNCTMPLAIEKL